MIIVRFLKLRFFYSHFIISSQFALGKNIKKMDKIMKKNLFFGVLFLFVISFVNAQNITLEFNSEKAIKDSGSKTFNGTSALQTVKDMKTGWNLGNTLDASSSRTLSSETSWGQPMTTKAMIDTLAKSGIKTIRIPTSWSNHIIDRNYTIDPNWMTRVKTIVDWALENDMYVILNSHHDCYEKPTAMKKCSGYYPNSTNYEESARFLLNIWTQISTAFNNGYDEHLIFETMNEPRLRGTNNEWWNDINSSTYKDAAETLNKLNQVALDAIRATGGNNQKRYVMIPGLRAAVDSAIANEFKLPKDNSDGKLIISVHMYDPYDFAMQGGGSFEFKPRHQSTLESSFDKLNTYFVSKGIPVIIGEYGATNKGNLEERVKWFKFFLSYSRRYGITSILWDNGGFEPSKTESEKFGFFDRRALKWRFPEILEAILKSTK